MKFLQYSVIVLSSFIVLTSCSRKDYDFKLNTPEKTILGQKVTINLEQLSDEKIDSVQLFVGKKQISVEKNNTATFNSTEISVGNHQVTALVFAPNVVKKVTNSLKVYANTAPKAYSYKLLNVYPHDKNAYTQGLEFHNGYLYETTGRVGTSWLRKVDYKTGEVLEQKNLNDFFGEGMTIMDNSVYWLTWLGGRGFTFDVNTFKKTGEFHYNESEQGWGMTHNSNQLIKSDGTNKLYFLNKKGEEQRVIQATSNKGFIDKLNEIEYVNGKIYANRWITSTPVKSIILIIDAKTGIINGVLDLNDLREQILKEQNLNVDEVLNGIAYNPETKTFFVTGKHWGKMFEIEISE